MSWDYWGLLFGMPKGENGHAKGKLIIGCGEMDSGKSLWLVQGIEYARLRQLPVQVFIPANAMPRDCDVIYSRAATVVPAERVAGPDEILQRVRLETAVVAVDEVHFWPPQIIDVFQQLMDRGITVIAAGLDQTFRGEPFGSMGTLLALAYHIEKIHGFCSVCGKKRSSKSQRFAEDGSVAPWDEPTHKEAKNLYKGVCVDCWRKPSGKTEMYLDPALAEAGR